MYILTKFFQITLLLLLSLILHIIPWKPSWVIENIVNFSIVGLFVLAGYLVYLIVKKLYVTQKKTNLYKSAAYTFLLLSYLGVFAIVQIGLSFGNSTYLKTYEFKNVIFYTYETVDGGTEISTKDARFPIRSVPIATFPYEMMDLIEDGKTIYAVTEDKKVKVYDLKNKEKDE